ncbi:hypothetical protein C8F04DRAFT_227310 [Mycena alexandri]|uniref:F-box domain-containing protein n=1 Tax=Mycena alexandri TaxID=1745969 RepID=A0AAD6T6K4_9AGAR|nr:hypothetical protein C8F04DRAFT_227310 [Mycena alexandri]
MTGNRTSVDPVLTLPVEITSEFFYQCLPTSCSDREWNTPDPREAPMLLLHVCKAWREIAISTSVLWSKMEFSMHNNHGADLWRTWLTRAEGRVLFIKLHRWIPEEDEDEDSESEQEMTGTPLSTFLMLVHCAERIQSLELSTITINTLEKLAQASRGTCNFLSLEKLTVGLSPEDPSYDQWPMPGESTTDPVIALTNSPLLHEVSLVKTPPSVLSLPWHQITTFTGTRLLCGDCLEVLQLSSNLTECAVATGRIRADDVVKLTHSHLTSLTLFTEDGYGSADLLESLTLPALQTLHILDADDFDENELNIFLSRSSPPLRKFVLRENTLTSLASETFQLMPSLTELEVWNPQYSVIPEFFRNLGGDPKFLPRLQHLAFVNSVYFSGILGDTQRGLKSRWDMRHDPMPVAQLQSFRLTWKKVVVLEADALLPFRALIAEGLDISIESTNGD